jgi:hypothetical protein
MINILCIYIYFSFHLFALSSSINQNMSFFDDWAVNIWHFCMTTFQNTTSLYFHIWKFKYFETKTCHKLIAQPLTYDMFALIELNCIKVKSVNMYVRKLTWGKLCKLIIHADPSVIDVSNISLITLCVCVWI